MGRLCAHLDALLSRAKQERRQLARRNKYLPANQMRVCVINLVDELHYQAARWPVDHYDSLYLVNFLETDQVMQP